MFFLANVCTGIANVLGMVLQLYGFIVLVAVLIKWVQPNPFNPIIQFLDQITEPVFQWVRRRMPFVVVRQIDLSPVVVFLAIVFLRSAVVQSLFELSLRLR